MYKWKKYEPYRRGNKEIRYNYDKRRVFVKITEKGKVAIDIGKKPSLLNEDFNQKFNKLEDWEQTLILSSIQRIASMMEAEKLAKKDRQKKLEKFKVDKI